MIHDPPEPDARGEMSSPYGSHFDGARWPWTLDGSDDWYALHDAASRYISDACVEGDTDEWRAAAAALRARENYSVKRLALSFVDGEIRFWSPRNSVGGYATLADSKADELADIIELTIAPTPATRGSR